VHWAGVSLAYGGFGAMLLGAISVIWPLRRIGIRTRRTAVILIGAGVMAIAAAAFVPAPAARIAAARSGLDAAAPEFEFSEFHALDVQAPPDRVFEAIGRVTADEIALFRLLTWIRSPRRVRAADDILAARGDLPVLQVALAGGFFLVHERAGREIVLGTFVAGRPPERFTGDAAAFAALETPGLVKAAMNFAVIPLPGGATRVTTETRVHATDPAIRRRFALYWRTIYPGSALIRRMWLRAIAARASADS
jgi:hypothetical protein